MTSTVDFNHCSLTNTILPGWFLKPLTTHPYTFFLQYGTQKDHQKNTPLKSKATQAKGKENAALTAALQAAKKKNQLRKDSGLGMLNQESQAVDEKQKKNDLPETVQQIF